MKSKWINNQMAHLHKFCLYCASLENENQRLNHNSELFFLSPAVRDDLIIAIH